MLGLSSDSFRERTTMTNSEVNHLFNVTPGANFTSKVWPSRKNSNASNSLAWGLLLGISRLLAQTLLSCERISKKKKNAHSSNRSTQSNQVMLTKCLFKGQTGRLLDLAVQLNIGNFYFDQRMTCDSINYY